MSASNTPAKTPQKQAGQAAKSTASSAAPSTAGSTKGDDASKALEKLEIKTKAVNANNVARVANSQLTSNDEKLHPLVSLKTGKAIEKFPGTSKDIEKLTCTFSDVRFRPSSANGSSDTHRHHSQQSGGRPHWQRGNETREAASPNRSEAKPSLSFLFDNSSPVSKAIEY